MLIIYHSRDVFSARQAAALHAGRLAPGADWHSVRDALGGDGAPRAQGLWQAADSIYALGQASQPQVVVHAFDSLAESFAIDRGRYVLAPVGPTVAWSDRLAGLLRWCGLSHWAEQVEVGALLRGRPAAEQAVAQTRRRLGEMPS
jgi:hypothetical protein